jgi:hypothetical protein
VVARSLTDNRELVDRTERALDGGALAPADLRRLLTRADRQRAIDPGGLFRALGVLTAIAGAAFLYAHCRSLRAGSTTAASVSNAPSAPIGEPG